MEPKDLILPAAAAIGGFFIVRTVMARRAEAAAALPSSGGKELPPSGGASSGGSGRTTRHPAGADLQRYLNALRDNVRDGAADMFVPRTTSGDIAPGWPTAALTVDGDVGPATQRAYNYYRQKLARLSVSGVQPLPALDPYSNSSIQRATARVRSVIDTLAASRSDRQTLASLFT